MRTAWLVDPSIPLPAPPDHANTTTAAGQQVATESDLAPAPAPGAIPGAAPRPASRLGPALGIAPGPVCEDAWGPLSGPGHGFATTLTTTLATRPSLESAIKLAPEPGSKGSIHSFAPDLGLEAVPGPGPEASCLTGASGGPHAEQRNAAEEQTDAAAAPRASPYVQPENAQVNDQLLIGILFVTSIVCSCSSPHVSDARKGSLNMSTMDAKDNAWRLICLSQKTCCCL